MLVAITQRVVIDPHTGERRDALDQRWTGFLALSGLRPLLVPNDAETALDLVREFDPAGVILTGGGDLSALGGDAPERDAMEAALVDWSCAIDRPVLGVCRGMQHLLHLGGATLQRVTEHVRTRHALTIRGRAASVNSYHDWAALRVNGHNWDVLARADDGVIEAVQHRGHRWLGIMWHPEREQPVAAHDVALFREHFAVRRVARRCAA